MKSKSIFQFIVSKKTALFSCIYVIVLVLLAIFAVPLSSDQSPNANRMIVEIGAKNPGFKQTFLLVPKHLQAAPVSFFQKFFIGSPDLLEYIPITHYFINDTTVTAIHYIDEGVTDTLTFVAADFGIEKINATIIQKYFVKEQYFILGTDRYGRDVWSRILLGARVSLAVGLVTVLMSISIGLLLGALAGWYGGWVDNVIMYIVNILWSIPTLLLVFAITLSIGKGFWEVFLAIGLTSWVGPARLIRGQVMQLKEMDYITAARTLGFRDTTIIFKHVVPNIIGPIIVIATANFANAILVEAGLSFLGIGIQPPIPSWGLMIKEHYNFLLAGKFITAFIPGLAIMFLVLAFNLIGNTLRDYFDVRNT